MHKNAYAVRHVVAEVSLVPSISIVLNLKHFY